MPEYVDGYVLPIQKKNVKAYKALAQMASKVFRQCGAIEYRECVAEDGKVPCGVPFAKAIKVKPNEVVVFSWVMYKSRAHRDRVNKKAYAKMMAMPMPKKMPFDMNRMIYGGFETLVKR
jgi:uncharacterized protein YbaA (DUF1428 family)